MCQLCDRKGTREPLDASSVATDLRHLLSAKLEYVRHLAQETAQQGKQMLVFSFWTATLDLLEPILESEDIPYCRWQTCSFPLTCLHACLFNCTVPIMMSIIHHIRGPLPDSTTRSQSNQHVLDVHPIVYPAMDWW